MKKIKAILSLSYLVLIICFCGCANSGEEMKAQSYTYEDLNEAEKIIVDGVYEYYSSWGYSSEDFPNTKVAFFYEEDKLMFATYYFKQEDTVEAQEDAYYNMHFLNNSFCGFYDVNTETGKLSTHDFGSIYNNRDTKRGIAAVRASKGTDFFTEQDEQAHMNALATAYKNKDLI